MIGDFIMNQLLGMKWLNIIVGNLLVALGIDIESRLGGSLHFFIYDACPICNNGI